MRAKQGLVGTAVRIKHVLGHSLLLLMSGDFPYNGWLVPFGVGSVSTGVTEAGCLSLLGEHLTTSQLAIYLTLGPMRSTRDPKSFSLVGNL